MELFAANNLSRRTPELASLGNGRRREEVYDVLEANYTTWRADTRDVLEHPGPDIISSNYLVVLEKGKVFLKCRLAPNAGPRLRWEAELAATLSDDGLAVARPLRNDSQEYVSISNGRFWTLYEYHEGDYFTGLGRELESACETFAGLAVALARVSQPDDEGVVALRLADLSELQQLTDEAATSSTTNNLISELCRAHRSVIETSCQQVSLQRDTIESSCKLVHTDFHPLNLLCRDGEVVCVLDFEDIVVYPVLAALGFGVYKLIRQMMVDPRRRESELQSPTLAGLWQTTWARAFGGRSYSVSELGLGARYRVLDLMHKILFASLRQNDSRYEYDLGKHIGALYEINLIFK